MQSSCKGVFVDNDPLAPPHGIAVKALNVQRLRRNFEAEEIGASEGIRTLDIHVGNVTLYQTELRSRSEERGEFSMPEPKCKRRFWPPAYRHARHFFFKFRILIWNGAIGCR